MQQRWIDYSFARPSLAVAKSSGATGVLRYLSPVNEQTQGKIIDRPEFAAILAAGLDVTLNFEWYQGRCLEGASAGVVDGATARDQAGQLGYAHGATIYVSHDTDTRNDPAVGAYLDAFRAALSGLWHVGIYSGIDTMDAMLAASHADAGWQTLAWSGGRISAQAVLYQNGNTWFGGQADEDVVLRGQVGSHLQALAAGAPQPPAPSPLPKPAKPPTRPVPAGGTYVVRSGDTLSGIAARFGTSWQVLARINHLVNPNFITVGQRLTLPGAPMRPSRPLLPGGLRITVQDGDTLSGIAAKFNTTWPKLAQLNHLSNPNLIYPGTVLRVR